MSAGATVQFLHPAGHARVRQELDDLIESGSISLRAAVCFFTRAGYVLLRRHGAILNKPESFIVVSVDWPTDLDALNELHSLAPGHVYIHLGGATPKEIKVGRALMHSKVLLATGAVSSRLWTGSHNLTGQAITGGNIEAAIQLSASASDPVIQDAIAHLNVCCANAERFDPRQLKRYRSIQTERLPLPPWIRPDRLLVIHAESAVVPPAAPFTVHLRTVPTDFDRYFINDRGVRMYLHPVGGLQRGVPADFRGVTLWTGAVTGINRTDRHPQNGGVKGDFPNANYDLDLRDLFNPPVLSVAGSVTVPATSQIMLRMDGQDQPGVEVYSIEKAPVSNIYDVDEVGQELHGIDPDMQPLFTEDSLSDGGLLYRPVRGMKQAVRVAGYEETMRTDAALISSQNRLAEDKMILYEAKEAAHPADAFLFVSKHVIDRRKQ
jgi:hypothetical protein